MQAHLFGATGRTDSAAALAEHEADYTPTGVAVQMILALFEDYRFTLGTDRPLRVLVPAAGSGAFVRAVRAVRPNAHITALEARVSELPNLAAAADRVIIGRFPEDAPAGEQFDLIVDNIPFSGFESRWPLECVRRGLIELRAGVVAFYGLTQWGQSAAAIELLEVWTPDTQIRAGGRISHRGDGKTDGRECSLWVWHTPTNRLVWTTRQLRVLPAELRQWDPAAVPGTYEIEPALVERVRGYL